MKTQKRTIRYIVVDSAEVTGSADGEIITTNIRDIKSVVSQYCSDDVVIVAGSNLDSVLRLAFEAGTKLQLKSGFIQDFKGMYAPNESAGQNLFKLLSRVSELELSEAAVRLLFEYLKNQIPLRFGLNEILSTLRQYTHANVDCTATANLFKSLYESHKNAILCAVRPNCHPNLFSKTMDYQTELPLFLRKNDGIFGLVGPMASGKTQHGILPLVHACIGELNKKFLLITPTIALSKSLASKIDDSLHYQQHERAEDISHLPGLICCVNSAVSKASFFRFAQSCEVVIIDEWEECVAQLSEHLFQDNKLSHRAILTKKLYSLLSKDKVVLADALFSDMSARHITVTTGRELTLLHCSDALVSNRVVKVIGRNKHIDVVIDQSAATKCEVGFSDAGQNLSNKYFELASTVESGLGGKVNLVNADYLQSPEGTEFMLKPLDKIKEAMFTLFSPAITSGLHFPFAQFQRVNLFASETISPLKLLQSSGRFRNATSIQVSFIKKNKQYHAHHEGIRFNEVWNTTFDHEFAHELDAVTGEAWADRIIERKVQDCLLRQHYANNTLLLFEQLGAGIIRVVDSSECPNTKLIKSDSLKFPLELLTEEMYRTMLACFDLLSDVEKAQVQVYQALEFYNVLNRPELHQSVLEFDQNGEGQLWVRNVKLSRIAQTVIGLSTGDKILQLVTLKVLEILGLDVSNFVGSYDLKNIEQLESFLRSGRIQVMGKDIQMKFVRSYVLGMSSKNYQYKGALSKSLLNRLLGLQQVQAGRDKSNSTGEYSYKVCPESVARLNHFYNLAAQKSSNYGSVKAELVA